MVSIVSAVVAAAVAVMRGWLMVAAIVVRVVVVVVVIPDVDSVAAVLVAPLDLGLEVRPLAVLVSLNCVVRIAASIAEFPGVRIGDTSVLVVLAVVSVMVATVVVTAIVAGVVAAMVR